MLGTGEKKEKLRRRQVPRGPTGGGRRAQGRPGLNGRRGRALAGTWDAAKRRIGVELAPRGDEGSLRLSVKYENVRLPGAADAEAPRGPAVWEEEVAPAAELRTPLAQFEELRAALVELDPSAAIDDAAAAAVSELRSFAGTRPSTASIAAAPCNSHTEATAPALVHALRAAGDDAFDAIVRQQALDALSQFVRGHARRQACAAARGGGAGDRRGDARARRRRAGAGGGAPRARQLCQRRRGVQGGGARGRRRRGGGGGDARLPEGGAAAADGRRPPRQHGKRRRRCQRRYSTPTGRRRWCARWALSAATTGCSTLAASPSPTSRPSATPPRRRRCAAGAAAAVAAALDRWGAPAAGGSAAAAGVRKWGVGALRNWRAARPSASRQSPTRAGSARSRG